MFRIIPYQPMRALPLLLTLFSQTVQAQDDYVIDPIHTRVAFHVMHAGFSPSIGTVSKPSGYIWFHDPDRNTASIDIQFPVNSLDMGDADWNQKILSHTFLSADKYPVARFTSTAIWHEHEHLYTVEGVLSIAGKSITTHFNATLNASKRHPLSLKQTIGLQASIQFSRQALGIDAWQTLVGDTIYMDVSIEAIRANPANLKERP